MTVIVCLDNANGMMFNHRRQSRDANVVKDILKTINGASLLIAPYSESLFSQAECSVSISESFLADADVYGFAQPDRFSNMLSVATAFDLGRLLSSKKRFQSWSFINGTEITRQISILTLTTQAITSSKLRLTLVAPLTKRSRKRCMSDEPLF